MERDHPNELSEEQLADLARLVDGTLPPGQRAEVEARVAASPHLASIVERQGVAVDALRGTAEAGAPVRLRSQVERRRARPSRAERGRRRLVIGGATAAAAVVIALALALPSALSGGPSVADAAALAARSPTRAAPGVTEEIPQLLRADVDGVPFPNYAAKFGWRPFGAREDDPSGRAATTVYYERGGRRVAYTIVSGDALEPPSDARTITRGGVEYRIFRDDGRTVVTWERDGHTCVLSSTTAGAGDLVALADWRGKGTIPF